MKYVKMCDFLLVKCLLLFIYFSMLMLIIHIFFLVPANMWRYLTEPKCHMITSSLLQASSTRYKILDFWNFQIFQFQIFVNPILFSKIYLSIVLKSQRSSWNRCKDHLWIIYDSLIESMKKSAFYHIDLNNPSEIAISSSSASHNPS